MEHWYVYYKLPAEEAQRCLEALRLQLAALTAATGVSARLLRRADETGETATLMEVYHGVADPPAFAAALETALPQWPSSARGARRTERFVDC
ncbi:MAG: DUF4936 family protein [Burkholderiales bacterium]|jgi:hypothetical protein|nr:DUF4936 family protein [Burkholderiales bacterium]